MRRTTLSAALAFLLIGAAPLAAQATHLAGTMPPGMAGTPAYSAAVWAGDTLYVSGTTDGDPATGKPPATATEGAKVVLDNIQRTITQAGLTMDDLVWVQVFATDLKDYAAFNTVYRTYFKGPLPARAFLGAGSLLNGAHFEVMGVAYRRK